ncbi:MAG TPA: glycosyltransferase [Acidimicrobiales bacterium]|jgi:glycosyltransferase involved in cell wall biosynthesis|nr:glycosyltransferase [Acidimicrobiales bacterium]
MPTGPETSLSPRRPQILFYGTYDAKAHPRVQVVIDGLRSHGLEVVECNVPLGLGTQARVALLAKPWTAPLFVIRLLSRWVALWRQGRTYRDADVVLVPYMGHFDVHLARRRFRRTPIVLDYFISGSDTAKDRNVSNPVVDRVLTMVDHAALKAADVAMVDTDEHLRLMPDWAHGKGLVVLIGASDEWVAPSRPAYDGTRPLKVIFFGLFTPLQGSITIGRALGQLADDENVEVTMAGDGQDLLAAQEAATANPRVEWKGLVPSEQMPSLCAEHDVCLGIFADNPKGMRVVPNKVYQGIRAGCAIVTSDTRPQRRTLGDLAVYVAPADPTALAGALRGLAADPARVAALQAASRSAAARFGPAGVVGDLVARVEAIGTRVSG